MYLEWDLMKAQYIKDIQEKHPGLKIQVSLVRFQVVPRLDTVNLFRLTHFRDFILVSDDSTNVFENRQIVNNEAGNFNLFHLPGSLSIRTFSPCILKKILE